MGLVSHFSIVRADRLRGCSREGDRTNEEPHRSKVVPPPQPRPAGRNPGDTAGTTYRERKTWAQLPGCLTSSAPAMRLRAAQTNRRAGTFGHSLRQQFQREGKMKIGSTAVRFRLFLVPLFLLLACAGVYAQANSEITGIVTDQTGAVVAGATITLTDPATGAIHTTTSGGTGLYDMPGLNPANYDLKITASGFQTFIQTGIVINTSAVARVDPKLTVGAESTTVTVEANALAVQGDSNVISTLSSEQQITELATNGRNVVALAALGLGVSGNLPDSNMPTSVGSNFAISFNGLNQAHNIWLLDGGESYDRGSGGKMSVMPSQDALAEFQVLASNYPADYGTSSGGTVSMAIKSGTSRFHGEAWEFARNDAFKAHNYFDNNNGQRAKLAELRYNVFGFNVGGPAFIPKIYNTEKKKTFFFYNEEWRRIIQGQASNPIRTVPQGDNPTSAQDFVYKVPAFNNKDQVAAGVGNQVFVPQVSSNSRLGQLLAGHPELIPGQPFPGNKIPGDLVDPNALLFNGMNNVPAATNPDDTFTPTAGKLPT